MLELSRTKKIADITTTTVVDSVATVGNISKGLRSYSNLFALNAKYDEVTMLAKLKQKAKDSDVDISLVLDAD